MKKNATSLVFIKLCVVFSQSNEEGVVRWGIENSPSQLASCLFVVRLQRTIYSMNGVHTYLKLCKEVFLLWQNASKQ